MNKDEIVDLIEEKLKLPLGRRPWLGTLSDIRSLPEVPKNSR